VEVRDASGAAQGSDLVFAFGLTVNGYTTISVVTEVPFGASFANDPITIAVRVSLASSLKACWYMPLYACAAQVES
jgi:hypothetical protein